MTHPDTSLREGVSFALLFDLRGSCGSLVSEFHELWPWIESKSGHQLFCVMEYMYNIYIRIYDYVCNDGTNIEFHNIILYYNCYSTISSAGGLGGFRLVCRHWPCKVRAKLHRLLFHFRLRPWEKFSKNARPKSCKYHKNIEHIISTFL